MVSSSKCRYLQTKLGKIAFKNLFNNRYNMKKSLLLCLLFGTVSLAQTAFSQEINLLDSPNYTGEKPVKVEVLPAYVPMYVISDKELPSYFVAGEIPNSFPRYDGNLTKEKNEIIALKWCGIAENRALLTEEAKVFVDEKTIEFKKKYNQK